MTPDAQRAEALRIRGLAEHYGAHVASDINQMGMALRAARLSPASPYYADNLDGARAYAEWAHHNARVAFHCASLYLSLTGQDATS